MKKSNDSCDANDSFRAAVRILRSMAGDRIARVLYKGSIETSGEVDLGGLAAVHEVDQAVVISTDSAEIVLEWRICGSDEFLNVLDSPTESAAAAVAESHDVTNLPPWNSLAGSVIAGVGVATRESEEGYELLWAMRLNADSGASVVVALGELRGEVPHYQPDNMLTISDPKVARSYQILDAAESAWGRDLPL